MEPQKESLDEAHSIAGALQGMVDLHEKHIDQTIKLLEMQKRLIGVVGQVQSVLTSVIHVLTLITITFALLIFKEEIQGLKELFLLWLFSLSESWQQTLFGSIVALGIAAASSLTTLWVTRKRGG